MSIEAHFVLDEVSNWCLIFNSKFLNLTEEYANNKSVSEKKPKICSKENKVSSNDNDF
jgi:hypothetical protein